MFSRYFIATLVCIAPIIGNPIKIKTRQSCSVIHFVHAAGATEEGLGGLGTPISVALSKEIPGTTSYGVPYDTSPYNGTVEYNNTITEGAALTTQHLRDQAAQCSDQRFILSGASKGAIVLHSTNFDSKIKRKVLAVLVFGDPGRNDPAFNNSWPINSPIFNLNPRNGIASTENVVSFCNDGDTICETGKADPNALPLPHFTYAQDGSVEIAVNYIKAKVQSNSW
ncbi:cutinase [Rhizoctonia solani]|nr:cutinase [Rhizoctonia solani]